MWCIYNDRDFEVEFFFMRGGLRLKIFSKAKFNMCFKIIIYLF